MKYSIKDNWVSSLELLLNKPLIVVPYIILAFFETLSLELIYFSTRKPLMSFANPIIKKLFGESFTHYPGNILIMPKTFFFMRIAIYVLLGVFLSAIAVNIVKNLMANLPLKINALVKNASKQYLSFAAYGILVVLSLFLLQQLDKVFLQKAIGFVGSHLPAITTAGSLLTLFVMIILNIFISTFLISTVPIMVIRQKALFPSLWESVYLGIRGFFTIFPLIFVPSLLYLPILLLKTFPQVLIEKISPETIPLVMVMGIIFSLFIDCFIIACISRFILDIQKKGAKK